MRFGLTTPILTLVPSRHGEWERAAGVEGLRALAVSADQLGYSHLTCSDHVAIPSAIAAQRGARYFDPFSTLGYIAAVTERIRLVTHVLVLPYHHPLEVAKRIGTLDHLAHGRMVVGVGVGSLREEFELLGVDFASRGARFEDALRALRAALAGPHPEYGGPYFSFRDFVVDPCAVQLRVPIWVGGRTARSLRRALQLADGWDPFGLSPQQLELLLAKARQSTEWEQRAQPFDLVLAPERPLDLSHVSAIADTIDLVAGYADLGASALNLQFRSDSLAAWQDQAATFMAKVAPRWLEQVP